jgi:hypothetical protein
MVAMRHGPYADKAMLPALCGTIDGQGTPLAEP